jgi:hypothetical protein
MTDESQQINQEFQAWAKRYNIKPVATEEVHGGITMALWKVYLML